MIGARLLPHLEGITTPWVVALIERIQTPGSDPEAGLLGVSMVCASAPASWSDVVAFAEEHPGLLNPAHDTTTALLSAVAYSGCVPGSLMPVLLETAVQQERWLTLLAIGEEAIPAIRARLAEAGEDAASLEQVLALLGG